MAQKLPTTRQKKPRRIAVTRRTKAITRRAKPSDLNEAFAAFTQVAGSLETSYHRLSDESARLRAELAAKNQENDRMRASMACILENLPCGVIALDAVGDVRLANPEARRLIELNADTIAALRRIEASLGERELTVGDRRLAIACAMRDGFAIFLIREVADRVCSGERTAQPARQPGSFCRAHRRFRRGASGNAPVGGPHSVGTAPRLLDGREHAAFPKSAEPAP